MKILTRHRPTLSPSVNAYQRAIDHDRACAEREARGRNSLRGNEVQIAIDHERAEAARNTATRATH